MRPEDIGATDMCHALRKVVKEQVATFCPKAFIEIAEYYYAFASRIVLKESVVQRSCPGVRPSS
jgi:hypothetical protein